MSRPGRLARALALRAGEGRTLAVLGGYMFLATATTTVLTASQNGLFLSVYPGRLIPYAVIAAALLTAVVAVAFAGVIAGTARRSMALGLTLFLAVSLALSRTAFDLNPRNSFAVYLWLSAVQVLILTHAWDYAGDLLTGRQAKRIMPLIGIGASLGGMAGGVAVAPAALALGTANLLLVAGGLLVVALPLLWAVPEPDTDAGEVINDTREGAVRTFLDGAVRGFRSVGREPLLRVMAGMMIFLTLTGTFIELQFKLSLQAHFEQDRITAVMGLLSAVVGVATLLLQLLASRVIFPKLGVSFAARLHAAALAVAATGAAVFGGFLIRAAMQITDDTLQQSFQKPVEQVSLLPFPGRVKSATVATLQGVLQPLSAALAGVVAIFLITRGPLLPIMTALTAFVALAVALRHRALYMATLERALAQRTVDFGTLGESSLVLDRSALEVLARGLADDDPGVVVFSLSLLERLPPSEAAARALPLLEHAEPEVRAEAALVLGRLDLRDPTAVREALHRRLEAEDSPFVLASILRASSAWPDGDPAVVRRFLTHPHAEVRREALAALARSGHPDFDEALNRMFASSDPRDQAAAVGAVGDLGLIARVGQVGDAVAHADVRPAALAALASLGEPAVPVLSALLERRDLPLSLRRSVVTALGEIPGDTSRRALVELLEEPALGPPALTSLLRLRRAGRIEPIPAEELRGVLREEVRRGFRYALAASAIRADHVGGGKRAARARFVSDELDELRMRATHRVLRVLALSYDPDRMAAVSRALFSDDSERHSHALELLEGTLSAADERIVVPFAEATSEGFDVQAARPFLHDVARLMAHPLETLLEESDWWPRALALHALGRDAEISAPGRDPGPPDEERDMIPLIEKVMVLKGSQLFQGFPGNELAGIASVAGVAHLDRGQIVFHQGDPGDAFYMVVQGAVRITRDGHEVAVLGPREGFGEMAILDQETRSASAIAAEPTTLLRIDRDSFDQLIEQNPSLARGIYRVLNQRLRNTLAQLAMG